MVEDVNRNERLETGGSSEESRVIVRSKIVLEPHNGGGAGVCCGCWIATTASWSEAGK